MAKRAASTNKPVVKPLLQNRNDLPQPPAWNSMTHWLIVLVAVLPVLFSRVVLDPVFTVRHIFLSWFVLLFIVFFYVSGKHAISFSMPPLIKAVFVSGVSYGLWSVVSMMFAINVQEAGYETARHFLNMILLFLVMIAVQKESSKVLKLCKAVLVVSMVQSAEGIMQFFNMDFMEIPGNLAPFGFMAHRILFGSAQVLILPFILYVLFKSKKGWKYTGIAALVGVLISILISQTRSAWLAVIALVIMVCILTITFSIISWQKWLTGTLTGVMGIVVLTALLLMSNAEGSFSSSLHKKALSLIQPSSDTSSSSLPANARLVYWRKTILLIKDKPVFGVGSGNWKLAIPAYGTEGTGWEGSFWDNSNTVPSFPHNVYLQIAAESGIPGAILYFGVWIVLAIIAGKTIVKPLSSDIRMLNILMISVLTALAIDSMFSFPTVRMEHSLYIVLMGGVILGSSATISATKNAVAKPVTGMVFIITSIIVVNLFLAYEKFSFEKHMKLAMTYRNESRFEAVIQEVEAGKSRFITIESNGEPLEIHSSTAYLGLHEYQKALEEILIAKAYHPNNCRIYTTMGVSYAYLEQYDLAINAYLHALKLAPEYIVAHRNLGVIYFKTRNYSDCIKLLDKPYFQTDQYIQRIVHEARLRMEKNK